MKLIYDPESPGEYDRIYQALNEAIQLRRSDDEWWSETTSFYIVRTPQNSVQFAARIIKESGMREGKDRLVVINANVRAGAAWGKISDQTFFKLLPFVKKL